MRRRVVGWLLYVILLACVCLPLLWARGVFLPRSPALAETVCFSDGSTLELTLSHSRFTALRQGLSCWQSEPGWHVQDFLTGDLDRDGSTELLLLVWRRGNYGSSKPFWVKQNDTRWSQHIFIYDQQNGQFTPQWMSSQLRPQVARWQLYEKNQLFILTPDGTETLWQWGQWGLVRTA